MRSEAEELLHHRTRIASSKYMWPAVVGGWERGIGQWLVVVEKEGRVASILKGINTVRTTTYVLLLFQPNKVISAATSESYGKHYVMKITNNVIKISLK